MTGSAQAATLVRRGLALEYLTLGWNVIGTAVLLASALTADSVALVSFALDSMIEVLASVVVVWQLTGKPKGCDRRLSVAAARPRPGLDPYRRGRRIL